MGERLKWPGWVYSEGEQPDYRFSLANERTFLAWIRTSLALIAGGVATSLTRINVTHGHQQAIALVLIGAGTVSAASSWFRWAATERAMRTGRELSGPGTIAVLAATTVLVGLLVLLVAT